MVTAETFRFLNEEHRLVAAADWNNQGLERLWLYNLHYFDDLCAAGTDERADWHRALDRGEPCRASLLLGCWTT